MKIFIVYNEISTVFTLNLYVSKYTSMHISKQCECAFYCTKKDFWLSIIYKKCFCCIKSFIQFYVFISFIGWFKEYLKLIKN